MWPCINVTEGTIENLGFTARYFDQEECSSPNICIKEIVMIYSDYNHISFDKCDVPLVVEYDTEFGLHVILFSKVKNLQYVNEGIAWIATYTSDTMWHTCSRLEASKVMDDGKYVKEEQLTLMFKNMLEILKKESEFERQNHIFF